MTEKKCETCEQRWLLELYGYPAVREITISHETPETVTLYEDRGVFGASTRRMAKKTSSHEVFKTEVEALKSAYDYAESRRKQIKEDLNDWEDTANGLGTRIAKLNAQQTAAE